MPITTARLKFSAVSWLTVFTVVVMLAAAVGRRYLTIPEGGAYAHDARLFMRATASQGIDWKELTESSIAKAIRERRPILLVSGQVQTRFSRFADKFGFGSPEVADISREFVCIRVDRLMRPWVGAGILPLSNAREHRDLNMVVAIFDENQQLIQIRTMGNPSDKLDGPRLVALLKSALKRTYESDDTPELQTQRFAEQRALSSGTGARLPDLAAHLQWLEETADPETKCWPAPYALWAYPQAYDFILNQLGATKTEPYLLPLLQSGMIDWVDGGFYYRATGPKWTQIDYDKSATRNADLGLFFARMYGLTGRPVYRILAIQTFDDLAERFAVSAVIRPFAIGDDVSFGRSVHGSFSPRFMRENFSPEERETMRQALGLRVEQNLAMLPMLPQPLDESNLKTLDTVLPKMREAKEGVERRYATIRTPAVGAAVAAKLLQIASLVQSPERTLVAERFYAELAAFDAGDGELKRTLDMLREMEPILSDYLAMADAHFQFYVQTGSDTALQAGYGYLAKALQDFQSEDDTTYVALNPDKTPSVLKSFLQPQIYDDDAEAPIATLIRLTYCYGAALLAHQDSFAKQDMKSAYLMSVAQDQAVRFGGISTEIRRQVSGFFLESRLPVQDVFYVVRGKRAAEEAQKLARQQPYTVVVPIVTTEEAALWQMYRDGKPQAQGTFEEVMRK